MPWTPAALSLLLAAVSLPAVSPRPAPAQEPGNGRHERILERFRSLPEADQDRILERFQEEALDLDCPTSRVLKELDAWRRENGIRTLDAEPSRNFEADRYAPALRLKTRILEAGDRAWRLQVERLFANLPVPDPYRTWSWSFGRSALIHPAGNAPDRVQRLAAWIEGWPASWMDSWIALAAGRLQADPDGDPVADYFEHHYRDRKGRVYAGIRLYDVWGTEREFEVSDVEAIAWLRTVAGEKDLQSPIPGRLHEPLYRRIEESYRVHREARSLREALALALLDPWSPPSARFRLAAPRLEEAWVRLGQDLEAMVGFLEEHPDAESFVEGVDRLASERRMPGGRYEAAAAAHRAFPTLLARRVRAILREEGLLGAVIR